MNHIIVRLGIDALEAFMHSITNMAEAQLEIVAAKNLSEIQIKQMDKELQLLQKYSTPIPYSPSVLLKKKLQGHKQRPRDRNLKGIQGSPKVLEQTFQQNFCPTGSCPIRRGSKDT